MIALPNYLQEEFLQRLSVLFHSVDRMAVFDQLFDQERYSGITHPGQDQPSLLQLTAAPAPQCSHQRSLRLRYRQAQIACRLLLQMGNRILIDHLPLTDNADGSGHLLNFAQQMAGYQNRNSLLFRQPLNQ